MTGIPYEILQWIELDREGANLSLWLQSNPDCLVIAVNYFRSEKSPDRVRRKWTCKNHIGFNYPLANTPQKLPAWMSRPKISEKFLLRLDKAYAKLLAKLFTTVEPHELHADNPGYDA